MKERKGKRHCFLPFKMKNRRFVLDKGSGWIVVVRPRYIKGLIEHKIIRVRIGTAAILFGRGEASASKRSFSGPLLEIEPRQGNNYQGRVTLIRKSCYFAILFCSSCPRLLFLTKTNFIPIAIDDMARSFHYISPTMCWNCTSRELLTEILPLPFLPEKLLPDTFSRSASFERSTNVDTNRKSWRYLRNSISSNGIILCIRKEVR